MQANGTTQVTIIGASGALGFGLAIRLAAVGVAVVIGSRSLERAQETVERAQELVGGKFEGDTNAQAASRSDVVFLSVPFRNQSENLTNLKSALSPGQILIDATVPLAAAVSGKATRTIGVWQGSAAQQAAEMVPAGVGVVSGLHTISAPALTDLEHPLDQDVLLCGDNASDKRTVAKLLERIDGLRCVDCGKLEMARITEQLTALLISVNVRYKTHAGIKLAGLNKPTWEK